MLGSEERKDDGRGHRGFKNVTKVSAESKNGSTQETR